MGCEIAHNTADDHSVFNGPIRIVPEGQPRPGCEQSDNQEGQPFLEVLPASPLDRIGNQRNPHLTLLVTQPSDGDTSRRARRVKKDARLYRQTPSLPVRSDRQRVERAARKVARAQD